MAELRAEPARLRRDVRRRARRLVPRPRTRAAAAVRRAPVHHLLLHRAARRDPGRVHRHRRPDPGHDPRRRASAAWTRRRRPTRSGRWVGRSAASERRSPPRSTPASPVCSSGCGPADDAGRRRVPRSAFDDFTLRVRLPRSQRVGDERAVVGDRSRAAAGGHRPDAAGRRRPGAPPTTRRRWPRPARPPSPGVLAAVEGDPETHGQLSAALAAAPVFLAGRERTKTNIIRLVNEMRVAQPRARAADGRARLLREAHQRVDARATTSSTSSSPIPSRGSTRSRSARRSTSCSSTSSRRSCSPARCRRCARGTSARPSPRPWPPGTTLDGHPRAARAQATGRARVVLDPSDPDRARARRRAHRADHRPGVDAAVRPGRRRRRRRRRPAQPRRDRVAASSASRASVSVTGGTRLIPDGAQVTVDGTAGTVTVH